MGGRGSRRATVNCRVSLVVHDETFVPGLKSRRRLLFLASGMLGLPLVLGVNPARPSFAHTKPRRSGRLCVAQPFRGLINSQQKGRFAIVTTLVLGGRSMGFGPCVHRVHAPRPQASRQRQLTGVVFSCAVGGWGLGVGCGSIRALSIMRRWLTVAGDWWGGEAVDLGADRSAVNDCPKSPDRHRREVCWKIRIGQVLREW
jgi:hypothetical protein